MKASAGMPAPPSRRQWLLALALGATVAACVWAAQLPEAEPADGAEPALPRHAQPARAAEAALPAHWALQPREAWPEAEPTALAAWQPAPPPQVQAPVAPAPSQPVPPPPPQAPPFPYQLIGRLVQPGRVQALLGSDQRSLAVQAGETIDGQWQVQAIGNDSVELLWLPARLPQTLRFKPL